MAALPSPDTDNYWIGKGYAEFQLKGGSTYVHLGNAPEIEWTTNLDVLDHFSSMAGVRLKDKKVVREKSATIRIVLEEMSKDNLGMALMGSVVDPVAPATYSTIDILSLSEIAGSLRIVGQGDIGPRIQWELPNVSATPSGSFNIISEEWGSFEITFDVLVDDTGSFGTVLHDIDTPVTLP
jgi:hypothetical protein